MLFNVETKLVSVCVWPLL